MTQTIPVSQARQRFGELINQVYKRQVRILVEKSGIPVATLVSLPDLERWLRQEQQHEAVLPHLPLPSSGCQNPDQCPETGDQPTDDRRSRPSGPRGARGGL